MFETNSVGRKKGAIVSFTNPGGSRGISLGFFFFLLGFGLLLLFAHPTVAQTPNAFCVFEKIDPHSPNSHVISRTDWLSVGKCNDDPAFMASFLWQKAPENPPSSKMTFAEAALLMDMMRLSSGSPGPMDRFHKRCDRSHTVWMKPGTNPPVRAYTHINWGTEDAGPGYAMEKTGLCCEDAALMVGTAPAADCRAFTLMSTGGLVAITPTGWVSLSGSAITFTYPGKPPIIIPSFGGGTGQVVAGRYALTVSSIGPQCHPSYQDRVGKVIIRDFYVRTGNGNQIVLSSSSHVYTTINPDGSFRFAEGDPATRFVGLNFVQYGQFPYRNFASSWRSDLRETVGRFSEGKLDMKWYFADGCVFNLVGTKVPAVTPNDGTGGGGGNTGGGTGGGSTNSNTYELRFGGAVFRTLLEKGAVFEGSPIDQYFYRILAADGEQVVQNGEKLWGRFVRVPSADTGNRTPVWWHMTWVFRNGKWVQEANKGVQVELLGKIP